MTSGESSLPDSPPEQSNESKCSFWPDREHYALEHMETLYQKKLGLGIFTLHAKEKVDFVRGIVTQTEFDEYVEERFKEDTDNKDSVWRNAIPNFDELQTIQPVSRFEFIRKQKAASNNSQHSFTKTTVCVAAPEPNPSVVSNFVAPLAPLKRASNSLNEKAPPNKRPGDEWEYPRTEKRKRNEKGHYVPASEIVVLPKTNETDNWRKWSVKDVENWAGKFLTDPQHLAGVSSLRANGKGIEMLMEDSRLRAACGLSEPLYLVLLEQFNAVCNSFDFELFDFSY